MTTTLTLEQKMLEIQKKGVAVSKDGVNPHFKSKYIKLEDILTVILPLASEQGLLISNFVQDGKLVTSISDGEKTIHSDFPLYHEDPQKIGAAMTYGRRYNLAALFNVVADEDDDGNSSAGEVSKVEKKYTPRADGKELIDYIDSMKKENDMNKLAFTFKEALENFTSDKQVDWITKVKDEAKTRIAKNPSIDELPY